MLMRIGWCDGSLEVRRRLATDDVVDTLLESPLLPLALYGWHHLIEYLRVCAGTKKALGARHLGRLIVAARCDRCRLSPATASDDDFHLLLSCEKSDLRWAEVCFFTPAHASARQ